MRPVKKADTHASAKAAFYKYVPDYKVTIESDDGVCRTLFVGMPGRSEGHFRILTAPGVLVITGDYGSFIFERTRDMFEFFGDTSREPNIDYWREKVQAGKTQEFCEETFLESVKWEFTCWAEGEVEEADVARVVDNLLKAFKSSAGSEWFDEHQAIQAWHDFDASFEFEDTELEHKFRASSPFEGSYMAETLHFVWCCYAIPWTIEQYRKMKAETVEAAR
jgi:hypothetical protein